MRFQNTSILTGVRISSCKFKKKKKNHLKKESISKSSGWSYHLKSVGQHLTPRSGLEIHFRRVCQGNTIVRDRKNTFRVDQGDLSK